MIAYNLGNLWRRLVLPHRIGNWSLTSLQQSLVKTGGRLVKHARYYWLLLAESHLTRRLFGAMLRRIACCPCQRDRRAADRADFSDQGGRGGKSVGGKGSKEGQFRALGFSGEAKLARSVASGSPNTANPTGNLPPAAVRCMLSVCGNSIMEILVYTPSDLGRIVIYAERSAVLFRMLVRGSTDARWAC